MIARGGGLAVHRPRLRFSPAFPWVTPRLVAALIAIAVMIAAGTIAPVLAYIGALGMVGLLGLLVADAALGPRRRETSVTRLPLDHLALRAPTSFRYEIENRSRSAVSFDVVDTPVDLFDLPEDGVRGAVGAGRRTTVELQVMPRERGKADLGDLFVSVENKIGLIRRRWIVAAPAEARVFPDLSAVERYGELARRGRLVEAGYRRMRLRGSGGEFDSLREFGPNDEFRAINWKATARRGKMMVSQYDIERSQTVMLVLDAGRLMMPRIGAQRKFDYAVTAALSAASIAGLADDKVGLMAFAGDVLEHIGPRSGVRHTAALTRSVFDLQPRFEESDYAGAFTYLRLRQPKRSLIIFFTDMFDPVASATVLANVAVLTPRHLVICVLMNDEAIERALAGSPETIDDAYRAGVAATLLAERRKAAAILAQRGVAVIDVPAAKSTMALINAYIDVKARNLL
ncbi:MAG TPA: DUF58 domain-containing protein [Candidatus Eremiobacteraceae bacterium]|nr:DUF58 domain-containing protein [Candidatus Eremiobacteraceae bacterium]